MTPRIPTTLLYTLGWLALSALVAITALQMHGLIVLAGHYVVNNPTLRPYGWSTNTVAGVSSMAYLVLGAITLGLVTFLEQSLRSAANDGELRRRIMRYTLYIVGAWLCVTGFRLLLL